MKRWTEDLRFFIGSFFLIVGFLLAFEGLRSPIITEGINLNLSVGVLFVTFAAVALGMVFNSKGSR